MIKNNILVKIKNDKSATKKITVIFSKKNGKEGCIVYNNI